MTATAAGVEGLADLRCAAQMRAAGADPVGTAGTYDGFLLVEWARPWPADLGEVPELEPVRRAAAGRRVRIQGLVPTGADRRRVVYHARGEGAFSGYRRTEAEVRLAAGLGEDGAVPPSEPTALGRVLGAAAAGLIAGGTGGPDAVTDVLVCTHGRRDRCCGSWGTELWRELAADPSALGDGVRLWRTSHTGGHRFAATMIVLPEGTAWGFLDAASALAVIRRQGPPERLLGGYRGCTGLASPALQALERAVLAEVGWGLLDTPRTGEELGDGRARLVVDPAGRGEVWEAEVRPGRTLPVPVCGAEPGSARKSSTELEVTGLRRG